MSYNKTIWADGKQPSISALRLNKIEEGIEMAHNALDALSMVSGEYDLSSAPIFSNIFHPVSGISFIGEGQVVFNSQQTILPEWFL
jgi:hypothetical protein